LSPTVLVLVLELITTFYKMIDTIKIEDNLEIVLT